MRPRLENKVYDNDMGHKENFLSHNRVRVRPTIYEYGIHSPVMCYRTAPARVSIHTPPGPGAREFRPGNRGRNLCVP